MPPETNVFHLHQKALELLRIRRFEEAGEMGMQALSQFPASSIGHEILARVAICQHQFDEGFVHLKQALELQPEDSELFRLMSVANRCVGKPQEGLYYADEALRIAPEQALNHEERGKCLKEFGRFPEARDSFLKARELDPVDESACRSLASVFMDLKNLEASEQFYREALQINPDSPATLNDLGVVLLRRGKKKEAALAFKAAVLADPTLEVAKSNTQLAVNQFLAGGTAVLLLVGYLILKVAILAGRPTGQNESWAQFSGPVALGLIAVFAIFVVGLLIYKRDRRNELEESDPQLMKVYNTIKRESRLKN